MQKEKHGILTITVLPESGVSAFPEEGRIPAGRAPLFIERVRLPSLNVFIVTDKVAQTVTRL